jgi:hypothetical protein
VSAWFNIYHSTKAGGMPLGVAVGAGLTPVVCSMLLSHVAAQEHEEKVLSWAAWTALVVDMALSLRAVGEVVRPAEGPLWWLFGPGTDIAEFVGLFVIMKRARVRAERRKRARAAQRASAAAASQAAMAPAGPPVAAAAGMTPAAVNRADQDAGPARRGQRAAPRRDDSQLADEARKEYRKSVMNREPLTDRALARKFPPKSRTWAAYRMAEVRAEYPQLFAATGTDDG